MNNPHLPQMQNPHAPQRINPHGPQANINRPQTPQFQTRPQGQINHTISSGKGVPSKNVNFNKPMMVNTSTGQKYEQETTFAEMDRAGILPECLYCDKRFMRAGAIRVHLRSHSGLRPYKCALCSYRHWYQTPMLTSHFVNVHGRKGTAKDVVTDTDEENKLVAKVEEEAQEVRNIQRRIFQGEPKPEKKIPDREGGQVFHEYYLGKYDDGSQPSTPKESTEEENNTSKKLPLSAKLSEAYNNNRNSPNSNSARNPGSNINNVTQVPSRVQNDPVNVPNELKQLPLDKLLNNEF